MEIYKSLDINNLENEVWKVITDFPDYHISNFGRVKSLKFKKEKILKQREYKNNHYFIRLYKNRKCKKKYIHTLVYEIFNNYKLKLNECVHHKDFNSKNNYYKNLKLMIKKEHNKLHMTGKNNPMFGKKFSENHKNKMKINHSDQKGEKNNNSILLIQDVIQIKLLLKIKKLIQREIADIFEISRKTISDINIGRSWYHIRI